MSRFERFGLLRVVLAGLFIWILVALHLIVAMIVIVATGVVALFGWRLLGATLRDRLERRHGG